PTLAERSRSHINSVVHFFSSSPLSSWKMWVDPSSDLPYVLMLVGDVNGSYTLYDPTEGYQVVYAARDYEEVKDFLLEDEYVQIRGRYQENTDVRKPEPVFA
ncbi:MAG: hypothetical protein ACKPCM_11330, partial [Pseudanabaena sp.]